MVGTVTTEMHEGLEQTCDTSASPLSLGGLDDSAGSSPKRSEWVKMNLDTGAAVNTFPLKNRSSRRWKILVNGFLMVELGNSKDMTKMDCSDL